MSTRSPHDTSSRPRDPAEQQLRVQLEGAWELLEQARDHQTELLERLDSRRWQHQLHKRLESLRQVREQEAPLGKALERAERRIQRESWPESHPLRLLTGQLRAQRLEVETLVRNRLAELGGDEDATFAEALERLEAKVRELPPGPPGGDELVLLSGHAETLSRGLAWAIALGALLAVLHALGDSEGPWLASLFALLVCVTGVGMVLRLRTRYWLTPRRLVWRPLLGGTEQIPLNTIQPDGVVASPEWESPRTLRIVGRQSVTLQELQQLEILEALLELHRRPPLLGRVSGLPAYPLAMFPAERRLKNPHIEYPAQPGVIVMRPAYVAFLAEQGLDSILSGLSGTWPNERPKSLTLLLLLQQLRLLPEADFDRCVEEAVRASGGELWPVATITHGPIPSGGGHQFTSDRDAVLTGFPRSAQRDAIGRVMHHWPEQKRGKAAGKNPG